MSLKSTFTKSTHSAQGNCVQARWAKSSHSYQEANCVEARLAGAVQVRDSKNPGPVLAFTPAAWDRFLTTVKGGPC